LKKKVTLGKILKKNNGKLKDPVVCVCVKSLSDPQFCHICKLIGLFYVFKVTKERLQLERHLQIANDSLQRNNGVDLQKYLSLVKPACLFAKNSSN